METTTCSSSLTPSSFSGATYTASHIYAANRLISSPLGAYSDTNKSHVAAAAAIGASWTASYDAAGDMTCRAPTSGATCAGTPTGARLSDDNQGQLAAWANAPSSPTSTDRFLYDGSGQRVAQVATTSGGVSTTTTASYGTTALSVNGTLSYTLSDGLGSVSESVSTSGAGAATQLYGPYGGVRYSNGSLPGTRADTGQHAERRPGWTITARATTTRWRVSSPPPIRRRPVG